MAAPGSDKKEHKSYTIEEAAAYDAGFWHGYVTASNLWKGWADAQRMLKVSKPVEFGPEPAVYKTDSLGCWSKDPNIMCDKCNCWKMTREFCS